MSTLSKASFLVKSQGNFENDTVGRFFHDRSSFSEMANFGKRLDSLIVTHFDPVEVCEKLYTFEHASGYLPERFLECIINKEKFGGIMESKIELVRPFRGKSPAILLLLVRALREADYDENAKNIEDGIVQTLLELPHADHLDFKLDGALQYHTYLKEFRNEEVPDFLRRLKPNKELHSKLSVKIQTKNKNAASASKTQLRYHPFLSSLQHFSALNKLGSGALGVVYSAKGKEDSQNYVLKEVNLTKLEEDAVKNRGSQEQADKLVRTVKNEHNILAGLHSANIVRVYSAFEQTRLEGGLIEQNCKFYYLVMEYCSGGDLSHAIEKKREEGRLFSEATLNEWSRHLISAVRYLHSHGVLHRDIKPKNVFLSHEGSDFGQVGCLKLGDFGFARTVGPNATSSATSLTIVGTLPYCSPELLSYAVCYNAACDVYSLGVTLYETAKLAIPFQNFNEILDKKPPPALPSKYTAKFRIFLMNLMAFEPERRPRMELFTGYPFLSHELEDAEQVTLADHGNEISGLSENPTPITLQSLPPVPIYSNDCYKNFPQTPLTFYSGAPSTIQSILPVPVDHWQTGAASSGIGLLIVCGKGQIIALAPPNWKMKAWQNDVSLPRPLQGDPRFAAAAYDAVGKTVYINHGNGVSNVVLSLACRESAQPKVAIDETRLQGRDIWGLAVDSQYRKLFLCAAFAPNKDISVWSLPENAGQPVNFVATIATDIVHPKFCALRWQNTALIIAISDSTYENGMIELRRADNGEMWLQDPTIQLQKLTTIEAKLGSPYEMAFDRAGNLYVADCKYQDGGIVVCVRRVK